MTNEKAIMCLEDMRIKVPIPKAAKQARENNEALDVAIKALKNEPHWIPCSEELPKEEGFYLVTLEDKCGAETTIRFFRIENGEHQWSVWGNETITAWTPLPEPYKEVTE